MKELAYDRTNRWLGLATTAQNLIYYNVGIETGLVFHIDTGNEISYPGTGLAWKDIVYNNVATISGATYNIGNYENSYLTFDGLNDYALVSGSSYLSLNTLTINFWTFSSGFNQLGYIFQKTTNGSSQQYEVFFNGNNNFYFVGIGLSTTTHYTATSTLSALNGGGDNLWNQFTTTWDGTNVRIYGNGITGYTSSNLTGSITANSTGNACVGCYGAAAWRPGGWFFNGRLGLIQIYNRALSAAEVLSQYNTFKTKYGR
jgi:hypothetical protein